VKVRHEILRFAQDGGGGLRRPPSTSNLPEPALRLK